MPRLGPLLIPAAPVVLPAALVPPSPQPVIEFPDDEVLLVLSWSFCSTLELN